MGPRGTLTFGLPLVAPFHVFPTVTEGAGYHHNGYTTAETLVHMNEDREIVPRLIREWSVSPDNTTWTFKLQEGAQFHKGYGELDAEGRYLELDDQRRRKFQGRVQRPYPQDLGGWRRRQRR